MQLIWKSLLRRKKEFRNAALVTFTAAFFMTGMLMLQQVMNDYVRSMNQSYYGNWVIASADEGIRHPYFGRSGYMTTSAPVLNQEGRQLALQIGSISEELAEFGGISLYEGRMPENEQEAAMDIYALSQLGCSYELGQEITLSVLVQKADKEKELPEIIETRTYILTGTIKSFSSQWVELPSYAVEGQDIVNHSIPEIILTEAEVETIAPSHRTWYYELDPAYQDADAGLLAQAIEAEHPHSVFNAYVYENLLWGNVTSLAWVALLMIVISVAALGFVLSSYSTKRLPAYYRLRMIGTSRRQLNRIITGECAAITVPFAAAGIAAAYLVSALVCLLIADHAGIPYFFRFLPAYFALQLGAAGITILAGIIAAIAGTGDRRLTAGPARANNKHFDRLRKDAKRCLPERALLKRQRRLHPMASVLRGCFEVLAISFFCLCLAPVLDAALTQTAIYGRRIDAEMFAMGTADSPPYLGVGQKELDYLEQIAGVKQIRSEFSDNTHYIYWDGIEDSVLIREGNSKRNILADPDSRLWARWFTTICCEEDTDEIRELIRQCGGELTEADRIAYEKGERLILFVNHVQIDPGDGSRYVIEDTSLQSSADITFGSPLQPELLTLPASIVHCTEEMENLGSAAYLVYVSQTFVEHLAGLEGKELRSSYLTLNFNELASFEATDKVLSDFAAENGFMFFSYAEKNRQSLLEDIVRPICIYGGFAVMTLILFVILENGFLQSRIRRSRQGIRLLRMLGADEGQIRMLVGREELKANLWYLAGLLPGFFLICCWCWQKVELNRITAAEYAGEYSVLLNEFTQRSDILALEKALFHSYLWLIAAAVIVLMLVMTCYETVRSCRAFRGKENQEV